MDEVLQKLDCIIQEIRSLNERMAKMVETQAQFDVLLTQLTAAITQFIADAQAKAGVDLTAEAAQVNTALAALTAADPNA
jgi:hypothetical protein